MKFTVFNALTEQNLDFELPKAWGDKRIMNVIYAPNAVGKSSLANILETAFTTKGSEVKNAFTKKRSTIKVIQNPDNINTVYKYDKRYASESAAFYNEKLIIIPKASTTFVTLKDNIESFIATFVKEYNKEAKAISLTLSNQKDLLKTTKLASLSLKTIKADHAKIIINLLNTLTPDKLKDTVFSPDELIEINFYITDDLISFIKKYKETVDEAIMDVLPEISARDHALYKCIYDYLISNSSYVNEKCLMCGETIFTEDKIKERLEKIKVILDDFLKQTPKESVNPFETINTGSFSGAFLKKIRELTRSVTSSNIMSVCLKLNELIEGADIPTIRLHFENHIINIINDLLKTKLSLSLYNTNVKNLEQLQKTNKSSINEIVKNRFSDYLRVLGFKYYEDVSIALNPQGIIEITFNNQDIVHLYNEVLSESEKTILSLSLFLAIVERKKALIIIDDPVDSHDQKNKFFILNQIYDFVLENDVFALVLTHDIKLSQMCSYISKTLIINNLLLTKEEIFVSEEPSIYFTPLYNYIYKIIDEINNYPDNTLFAIPLSILLRYLAKNQKLFFKEFASDEDMKTLEGENKVISRKFVCDIGFHCISSSLVHYSKNFDLKTLLNNIKSFSNMEFKPAGDINESDSIDTLEVLSKAMDFLSNASTYVSALIPQFASELWIILRGVYLRVLTESKLLDGRERKNREDLDDIAKDFKENNPTRDELYKFYVRNKPILNDFCHLDDGIDVIFNYQKEDIEKLITEVTDIKI